MERAARMFVAFAAMLLVNQGVLAVRELTKVEKILAARSLSAAGLPDPHCKTGVISMKGQGTLVCCAGYCGECTDYPTCGSVKGQDSAKACCATQVAEMACAEGAPANVCLKSCEEAVPPCIMPEAEEFVFPETKRNAGDDCNEAVPDWMAAAKNAVEGVKSKDGPDGEAQWKTMSERNFVPSSVVREKMEKLVGHLPDGFQFKVLDGNGDGGLSTDEMQKYFSSALPGGYDATVVNSIHDAFDSNKDGQVDKIEMSAGMAGMGGPKPSFLQGDPAATAFLQAMICLLTPPNQH